MFAFGENLYQGIKGALTLNSVLKIKNLMILYRQR